MGHKMGLTHLSQNTLSLLMNHTTRSATLPATLQSLHLHSNPWLCDCRLRAFRDWVLSSGLNTFPIGCTEPERLADRVWSEVSDGEFACKPEIDVPQSVVFSQPGANVTLSCFIVGSPMPEAKWVLKVGLPALC